MSSVKLDLSITRPHYLRALRRVLRPIARLMIRSGIRYDEFADVARRAYVESAIRDADNRAPRPTRDEIAWRTGISRERVDHYIESDVAPPSKHLDVTDIAVEALHKWYTDSRYLGSAGIPLELKFSAPVGPSFQSLIAQLDSDSNPEAVLERLLRAKVVTHAGGDHLRAVSRCLIWPEDVISTSEYWGVTLARVIETHEYNFNTREPEKKRLERSMFADHGVSEELLPSFHAFARERADQFLCDLDDWLGQRSEINANQITPRVAVGVNVFTYVEPRTAVTPTPDLIQPRRRSHCASDGSI